MDIAKKDGKIVILGAGITGLTIASELSKIYKEDVILLEKNPQIGGLASTIKNNGFSYDFGSHRLHEDDSEAFKIIKDLCGDDLLKRKRQGLIYIKDKFINYPPTISDIVFSFGLLSCIKFSIDLLFARFMKLFKTNEYKDFESFTSDEIGKSLYELFYKPYAMKLWARKPSEISKLPALNRVRKFTFGAILAGLRKKLKKREEKFYFYPSKGIGLVCERLKDSFLQTGGSLVNINNIEKFDVSDNNKKINSISFKRTNGQTETIKTSLVISTIPMDGLYNLVRFNSDNGKVPKFNLKWRCLRILYLITDDKIPNQNETYYFPESSVIFGRVSELNKYSPELNNLGNKTLLTIEIPCSEGNEIWNMTDEELTNKCIKDLIKVKILRGKSTNKPESFSEKVKNLYPIYELSWESDYQKLYDRMDSINNLYMIGRTALFLHCNIDHCMDMALKLSKYIIDGNENKDKWNNIRQEFFSFRVRE